MCSFPLNGMLRSQPEPDLAQKLADALAELEQTRWRLMQTQRLARLGSWERDLITGETLWSNEMFRIHGLTPGEITPTKELGDNLTHPDDRPLRVQWLERVASRPGTDIEQTVRIQLPTGEVRTIRARGTLVVEEDGSASRLIGTVQDITEETRSKQAEALLAQIIQSATEAILTTGLDGAIRSCNPAAERLYGYTAEELIGRQITELLPDVLTDELRQVRAARQQRLLSRASESEEYEEPRQHKDGRLIEIHGRSSVLRDDEGTVIGLVTTQRDITERRRAEERVAHITNHDTLTGLFNRHRFEEELAAASARAEHEGFEASVLLLDIDNFKHVNDAYGHRTGDELVRGLAEALQGSVGSSDVLARFGGDSFGVLSAPCHGRQAEQLAQSMLEAVRNYELATEEHDVSVSASVGVASFGGRFAPQATTAAELMADAERAMYESKESGRDRITVYSADDRQNGRVHRTPAEHLIRDALKHDSFELYAQPLVRLDTGSVGHVEILLRLRRDGQILSPGAFLPTAERQGLIHLIDYWVISHVFDVAAKHPDLCFAINLSGATIDDDRLESFIAQQLRRSGVSASRLVFELTETAAVSNIDRARHLAESLHQLGCRFAIDDFGAGFSTFYYLKHFPADYLKIDGEFVNDPRSETDQLVIQSIVQLAVALGKETIAEYVGDTQTLVRLRKLGVDLGQGYHFAKPFPVGELASMPRSLDRATMALPEPAAERAR